MVVRRTLSPSKIKKLLNPLSLYYSTFTYTKYVSTFSPLHIPPPHFSQNHLKPPFPAFLPRPFCSEPKKIQPFSHLSLIRDGNYDVSHAQSLKICPGCGVPMQDSDSKQPGFFTIPKGKSMYYKSPIDKNPVLDEFEISDSLKKGMLNENVAPQNDVIIENPDKNFSEKPVVCTRCHNLRYYGKVKDPSVENLLPDFDFDHTVGRRLTSTTGARSVVMMVVDASDFDGSFPKKVASLVSKVIDENSTAWKEGKSGNAPRILLVVTKIDLLPTSLSPTRLEHWVRTRAREGGVSKLTRVHLVSATRDWGVKNLVEDVIDLAGPRGQVWAIGAQNAGKSTLINAIGKCVGGNVTHITEAPVPGTTLGILRVEGVLPGKAKLFDTPGLLHPHQISTRLTRAEHKLVNISKELKPRTYRIKVGHSVHIGGLVRLDIEKCSADSLYITVWASPLIPLHMGKTENAKLMHEEQFGHQLQPPIGADRVEKLGEWVRKEFHVSGSWWDSSCVDIAISGLGWFAIGLRGDAVLGVWTYDGVELLLRDALLPHRSHNFEVTGFTVSEIVSKADKASSRDRKNYKRKSRKNSTVVGPIDMTRVVVETDVVMDHVDPSSSLHVVDVPRVVAETDVIVTPIDSSSSLHVDDVSRFVAETDVTVTSVDSSSSLLVDDVSRVVSVSVTDVAVTPIDSSSSLHIDDVPRVVAVTDEIVSPIDSSSSLHVDGVPQIVAVTDEIVTPIDSSSSC